MCNPPDDCSASSSPGSSRPLDKNRPQRPRQRRYEPLAVLTYIMTYQQTRPHRSPSERRIQAALDISAPSLVHGIIQRLERDGLLTITRYGRGHTVDLTLTEAGQEAVQRWQAKNTRDEAR